MAFCGDGTIPTSIQAAMETCASCRFCATALLYPSQRYYVDENSIESWCGKKNGKAILATLIANGGKNCEHKKQGRLPD